MPKKVCPQCNGKGSVRCSFGGKVFLDAFCMDCDGTGYVDVPEKPSNEESDTDGEEKV